MQNLKTMLKFLNFVLIGIEQRDKGKFVGLEMRVLVYSSVQLRIFVSGVNIKLSVKGS